MARTKQTRRVRDSEKTTRFPRAMKPMPSTSTSVPAHGVSPLSGAAVYQEMLRPFSTENRTTPGSTETSPEDYMLQLVAQAMGYKDILPLEEFSGAIRTFSDHSGVTPWDRHFVTQLLESAFQLLFLNKEPIKDVDSKRKKKRVFTHIFYCLVNAHLPEDEQLVEFRAVPELRMQSLAKRLGATETELKRVCNNNKLPKQEILGDLFSKIMANAVLDKPTQCFNCVFSDILPTGVPHSVKKTTGYVNTLRERSDTLDLIRQNSLESQPRCNSPEQLLKTLGNEITELLTAGTIKKPTPFLIPQRRVPKPKPHFCKAGKTSRSIAGKNLLKLALRRRVGLQYGRFLGRALEQIGQLRLLLNRSSLEPFNTLLRRDLTTEKLSESMIGISQLQAKLIVVLGDVCKIPTVEGKVKFSTHTLNIWPTVFHEVAGYATKIHQKLSLLQAEQYQVRDFESDIIIHFNKMFAKCAFIQMCCDLCFEIRAEIQQLLCNLETALKHLMNNGWMPYLYSPRNHPERFSLGERLTIIGALTQELQQRVQRVTSGSEVLAVLEEMS